MREEPRNDKLLRLAAIEFEKGNTPFCDDWLSDNGVTRGECMSLSERIAMCVRGYLGSSNEARKKIALIGEK